MAVFAMDDGLVESSLSNGRATGRDVTSDPFVSHISQLCTPERRCALCPSPPPPIHYVQVTFQAGAHVCPNRGFELWTLCIFSGQALV